MLETFTAVYASSFKWLNDNQGVLSLAVFIATILIGWLSGIFSALRRKPRLIFSLIDGPTFCCTFDTGKTPMGIPIHRTGICLYLQVANTGSAPTSIQDIHVGYHWHNTGFGVQWVKYGLGWFWLLHQTPALADFQANIGENIKVFPFLTQKSFLFALNPKTFLEVGRATNGVVYFEQPDSWGGCFPKAVNEKVLIKVRIRDVFGKLHVGKFKIPMISIDAARKYNPSFGKTFADLHNEVLPHDVSI